MNQTECFKIWDWDKKEWLNPNEAEDVLEFNWYDGGPNSGEIWAEFRDLKMNLEMVFKDGDGNFKAPDGSDG